MALTTIAPTVVDINTVTKALTGNENIFIKYYSNARFYFNEQLQYGAKVNSRTVTCGSYHYDDYPSNNGLINGVDSNTFYFSLTDTFETTVNKALVKELIPYIKLTASVSTSLLTTAGSLTFTVKGKYFNGSFGAKNNSMEIEYSVRDGAGNYVFNTGGSGWVVLGAVNPTVDSYGNYEYSKTITGLDYTKQYELTVNVIDELSPVQTNTTVIMATPVYDWSSSDFHHHTDVYLDSNKYIRTLTSSGSAANILGTTANGSVSLGYGNYAMGSGQTAIYGNAISLTSRGAVNINGSVLADFVVEQGSNGTWFYRKWNSGRCELHGYKNISSLPCNTVLASGWYRTDVQSSPVFPFTVYNPKTNANYESAGTGALIWFTTLATSAYPADFYLIRPATSGSISGVVNYTVTGTWK